MILPLQFNNRVLRSVPVTAPSLLASQFTPLDTVQQSLNSKIVQKATIMLDCPTFIDAHCSARKTLPPRRQLTFQEPHHILAETAA